MNPSSLFCKAHPKLVKRILFGYAVFAGCFLLPFLRDLYPFDFHSFYMAWLAFATYGIIGGGLAGIYGPGREKFICFAGLGCTAAGMVCRYFLEFGEVSNTLNFTAVNIVSFLAVASALILAVYHFLGRHFFKNSKNLCS